MPTVDVFDLNNSKVGDVELADSVFGADVKEHLIFESVRHYMACRRQGSAATKTRHEVAGSGKKLWRQKGTGRARMGSIRSPCGVMVVPSTVRSRVTTPIASHARCSWEP
jgi:large subunit ribosomal protein L4